MTESENNNNNHDLSLNSQQAARKQDDPLNVGQGLLDQSKVSQALDKVPTKQPKVKDELDLAQDISSSGLLEKGIIDENKGKEYVWPSGRFQQQASIQ